MNLNTALLVATVFASAVLCSLAQAQTTQPFDGKPWNLSTGNLSVQFIRTSPIGAGPQPSFLEPPPSVESLKKLRDDGLVNYEDYIAWGAVEREPGKWDWTQHDRVYEALHAAGLNYVVYDWVHFPPVWLRESKQCTLMKCLEHNQETNYVSIFDPKTIEHYDHFYKALHDHFGDKIDGVYACILGPYGEGNYPLLVPDFVNIGHCHEGYWCADAFAVKAHRSAMGSKYKSIDALNVAWGTKFASFDEVTFPPQIGEKFKPAPEAWKTPQERRRWLDFITWYHQAIIDFAERSIQTTLKYFPKEKVRTKPGGNAGGVNPIAWGTYCPGYAKMAAKFNDPPVAATNASSWTKPHGIVLQPADCQGAYFGDKWVGTSYQFYGVTLSTEPASSLDKAGFTRRMFSDASCGAKQIFTYEFDQHVPEIHKYAHLVTGQSGDVQIAVLCPTTLYRLGGDLKRTINRSAQLRDLTDFDVLDELLLADGALKADKYKALIIFQGDCIDQPILDKFAAYLKSGGTILLAGKNPIKNVEGTEWKPATAPGNLEYVGEGMMGHFKKLAETLKLPDCIEDGVWTTRRGKQIFHYNTTAKAVKVGDVEVPAHEIWSSE